MKTHLVYSHLHLVPRCTLTNWSSMTWLFHTVCDAISQVVNLRLFKMAVDHIYLHCIHLYQHFITCIHLSFCQLLKVNQPAVFHVVLLYLGVFPKWKSHLSIACEWISWKENSRLFHMVPYSVPERFSLETFLALKKWPLCFSNKCQLLWVSVGEPYKSVPSSWTFLLEKWMTVFSLLHSSKFWQRSQHWKQIKFLKIHKASSLCHSTRTTFWILPTFFFCLHLIVLYNYPSII